MVELARKQADGNLGPWMMQEPRAAPGGHLNMREQPRGLPVLQVDAESPELHGRVLERHGRAQHDLLL